MLDRHGGIATQFAVLLPIILGFVVWSIDVNFALREKNRLQSAADIAALAAARAADLPGKTSVDSPRRRATVAAQRILAANHDMGDGVAMNLKVIGSEPPYLIDLRLTSAAEPLFPVALSGSAYPINAKAEARVAEVGPICLFALSETASPALTVGDKATVNAPECGVHVNSDADNALSVISNGRIKAQVVSVVGDAAGSRVSPAPETESFVLQDPFADKSDWPAIPLVCDANGVRFSSGEHTLSPGHYCNGIRIGGSAKVTMEPGVYFVSGKELMVGSHGQLFGDGVTVFFVDKRARLRIKDSSYVELSAPISGSLRDFLFVAHPDASSTAGKHQMGERGQSRYSGVFYFPDGHLDLRMAQTPGWTPTTLIFVADTIAVAGKHPFRLAAQGQAGYVSTAARLER